MTRVAWRSMVAALCLTVAGCGAGGSGKAFRIDDRLQFVSPRSRAIVEPPTELRWTMRDFTLADSGSRPPDQHAGYFAVFVDRAPIAPGQRMDAIASGDKICEQNPGCPDANYLAQRQIFTTTETSFSLPQVLPIGGDRHTLQLHRIIVVLMDTAGHRIGESSWEREVRIRKIGLS